MSPVPSSLVVAARSGKVRGASLAVYIELHEWLDFDEYKSLAPWCIAERLKMSPAHVYNAMHKLCALGCVVRGPRQGNEYTYKLAVTKSQVA